MKGIQHPFVKVVWNDAHGTAGTVAFSEHEIPHQPMEIWSFGFLLRQDEVGVSIASEYCADNTWRGYTFVPSGMLIRIEEVGRRKKPAAKP